MKSMRRWHWNGQWSPQADGGGGNDESNPDWSTFCCHRLTRNCVCSKNWLMALVQMHSRTHSRRHSRFMLTARRLRKRVQRDAKQFACGKGKRILKGNYANRAEISAEKYTYLYLTSFMINDARSAYISTIPSIGRCACRMRDCVVRGFLYAADMFNERSETQSKNARKGRTKYHMLIYSSFEWISHSSSDRSSLLHRVTTIIIIIIYTFE